MTDMPRRWDAVMMGNYGTPPVALVRGDGARVWDDDGREYVDLLGGIAVNVLGHAHPAVVEAVTRQVSQLGHTSNLAMHEPGVRLAERLQQLMGGPDTRVLFCNSGAEANEAALKISRRLRPGGGWVACEGAFHGRTLGALAVTGQPAKRAPFEPLPGPVVFVPYGDADALRTAVTERTASVVLEPVMGEAGVVVPPRRLPRGRPRGLRRHRRPAPPRRGPGRRRPGRGVAHQQRRRPRGPARRRHPGQGPRRRAPAGCGPRPRPGRDRARQGRPRHDLRRQPRRLRRGPGRARDGRVRGAAAVRAGPRPAPRRRRRRPAAPARRPRPRARAVARDRAHRAGRRRRPRPPSARPGSSSTPPRPTCCGSPRRWS